MTIVGTFNKYVGKEGREEGKNKGRKTEIGKKGYINVLIKYLYISIDI